MIPHNEGPLLQSVVNSSQRIFHVQRIGIRQEESIDVPYRLGTGYLGSLNYYQIGSFLYSLCPFVRFVMVGLDIVFIGAIFYMVGNGYHIQPANSSFPHPIFRFYISIGEDGVGMKITLQSFISFHIGDINIFARIRLLCFRYLHYFQALQLCRAPKCESR